MGGWPSSVVACQQERNKNSEQWIPSIRLNRWPPRNEQPRHTVPNEVSKQSTFGPQAKTLPQEAEKKADVHCRTNFSRDQFNQVAGLCIFQSALLCLTGNPESSGQFIASSDYALCIGRIFCFAESSHSLASPQSEGLRGIFSDLWPAFGYEYHRIPPELKAQHLARLFRLLASRHRSVADSVAYTLFILTPLDGRLSSRIYRSFSFCYHCGGSFVRLGMPFPSGGKDLRKRK